MADDFERIKGNVIKMLDQSAPEADVAAYLKSERLTADEFRSVATGKMKLGDVRMTQKSQGEIARTLSAGKTIPEEGIWRGSFFPVGEVEATGERFFDPDAGILGMVLRAAKTPGDVMSGELDPQSEEGIRRTDELGMTFSPVGVASRAASTAVPGTMKALRLGAPKVPTAQELKAAGASGMEQVRSLGIDYSPEGVKSSIDDLIRSLEADGITPVDAPKTYSHLANATKPPEVEDGASVLTSISNLVALRKALQKTAGSGDATERNAASRAIDAVDQFIVAADPTSIVAGTAATAGPLLETARGNFAASFRSKSVTDAIKKGERNAAKSGSGANVDNAVRQRLDRVLEKEARGFSQAERKFLEDIIDGKYGTNLARRVGNALGGGGGLTQLLATLGGGGIGSILGGVPGAIAGAAAPAAVGTSLRALAGALTKGQARNLDEVLRMRSPLYQSAAESPPVLTGLRPEIQALPLRGLVTTPQDTEGLRYRPR